MLVTLNDILPAAKRDGYAVGLFNTVNFEMARGVLQAAEALRSPVIIGTAEVLLPYAPLQNLADLLKPMAERASVPVVLHYDHGLTFDACMLALKYGFTSVMYDRSTCTYDENLQSVAALTRIAHAFGASVEAELGHVGNAEGGAPETEELDLALFYTNPEQAADYVAGTGVDALAIAVGSAHGAYRLPPKLDFDRITDIATNIATPLVLHGGSGLTDEDFRHAIRCGISKVNIFTDINNAGIVGMKEGLAIGKHSVTDLIPYQVAAIRTATEAKMRLFGSVGKA